MGSAWHTTRFESAVPGETAHFEYSLPVHEIPHPVVFEHFFPPLIVLLTVDCSVMPGQPGCWMTSPEVESGGEAAAS